MIGVFILVVVFFPPHIKAEHIGNIFFQIGFGWGSLSRVDKENNEGKGQILFPWHVKVQRCYYNTYCSYLLKPNSSQSITTSVVESNKQFTFSKGFIFLNSIHTSCSLQT